jgi:hypothetical protein
MAFLDKYTKREPVTVLKIDLNGTRLILDQLKRDGNLVFDSLKDKAYMAPSEIPAPGQAQAKTSQAWPGQLASLLGQIRPARSPAGSPGSDCIQSDPGSFTDLTQDDPGLSGLLAQLDQAQREAQLASIAVQTSQDRMLEALQTGQGLQEARDNMAQVLAQSDQASQALEDLNKKIQEAQASQIPRPRQEAQEAPGQAQPPAGQPSQPEAVLVQPGAPGGYKINGSTIYQLVSKVNIKKGQALTIQLLDEQKGCSTALKRSSDNEFIEWYGDPNLYGATFSSGILQTVLQRKVRLGTLIIVALVFTILGAFIGRGI